MLKLLLLRPPTLKVQGSRNFLAFLENSFVSIRSPCAGTSLPGGRRRGLAFRPTGPLLARSHSLLCGLFCASTAVAWLECLLTSQEPCRDSAWTLCNGYI